MWLLVATLATTVGAPGASAVPPPRVAPAAETVAPARVLIGGLGPLEWNRTLEADRSLAHAIPRWPAIRISDPLGNESLYVFPARASAPKLLATWPRTERYRRSVRMAPDYRWLLIDGPDSLDADSSQGAGAGWRAVSVYAANGTLLATFRAYGVPAPVGRDFLLWPLGTASGEDTTTLCMRRIPSGEDRDCWAAAGGYGAAAPLENFLAVNVAAFLDPATGIRQDLLFLLDLEGKVLWSRPLAADFRDFGVSNFGDVAIAREGMIRVYDRAGGLRFRGTLPLNVVGRTAMGSDGRFVLAATSTPGGPRGPEHVWIALYDTRRKAAPLWSRSEFPERHAGDVIELSISDDGARSLVRFSTGAVSLLGRDGSTVATWDLPRVPSGEYQRGTVPRRTWLSSDGTLIALTTPVVRALGDARGWLYQVPRAGR